MKSFLSYLGGQSLLTSKIAPKIPPHICYCEVFAGAAWMFFRKEPSEVEIINDINTDLVTLYRVVKLHLDEFIRYLRYLLVARDEFERFKKEAPETLTDIQKAVRFYFLLKAGYGAKVSGQSFGSNATRRSSFNLLRVEEDLSEAHLRLSRVFIENLPYERVMLRFDKPTTFFYLDPPYYGCESDYGKGLFGREDFGKLRDILSGLKGKFILSLNDRKEVRELYKGLEIEVVKTSYTAAGAHKKKSVSELLIKNF